MFSRLLPIRLNSTLRREYENLFQNCRIISERRPSVIRVVNKMLDSHVNYREVSEETGVPWYVIACLHNMESGLDFRCHLHNGDPLSHKTIHVPSGRPLDGNPPYSWEESAADALDYDGLKSWKDWSISGILFKCEAYNGWGYRRKKIRSPYLWGASNHMQKGKYVKDGKWDANAVTHQIGVGTLLHTLDYLGHIHLRNKS